MEETPKQRRSAGKIVKLILKIVVTTACLWYVSTKIDFAKAGDALQKANWIYLFLALIAFVFSKLVSAWRLNIYFRNININLQAWANIKLYWLGMFYNLFLPGSIGGDAYKVIILSKKYNIAYRKTTAAVLLDRISGLLGLGLILAVYGFFVLRNNFYIGAIAGGSVLAVLVLYFVTRRYLTDFRPSFISTLLLGLLVQASQVIAVYLIMTALGIPAHATEYIFIFLVSSVVSVLPLTIGPLGIREVVFLEGSAYFGLLQENSVIISILFFLITLFTSAWGAICIYRDPLKK